MIQIHRYDPAVDEPRLLELWDGSFGGRIDGTNWPLTLSWLRDVALTGENNPDHLLADIEGQAAGFALIQVDKNNPPRGSLLALAVHPNYRGRGVGRILHHAALERLRAKGVEQVQLGAGAFSYFWPGVPIDLPGAWAFFQALGWSEAERSYDLIRSLDDYQTPAWVWERVRGLGVDFVTADEAKLERAVVDFVAVEEPEWKAYFAQAALEERGQDILLACRTGGGEILGACLLESPSQRWALRLRQPVRAPGCILTAQAAQGQGIGMALTARATEILQARGCRTSFLGWTWLVDWYGKLGYTIWQEYIMSWKDLKESDPR